MQATRRRDEHTGAQHTEAATLQLGRRSTTHSQAGEAAGRAQEQRVVILHLIRSCSLRVEALDVALG